jgi:hypothetical protein
VAIAHWPDAYGDAVRDPVGAAWLHDDHRSRRAGLWVQPPRSASRRSQHAPAAHQHAVRAAPDRVTQRVEQPRIASRLAGSGLADHHGEGSVMGLLVEVWHHDVPRRPLVSLASACSVGMQGSAWKWPKGSGQVRHCCSPVASSVSVISAASRVAPMVSGSAAW